MFTGGGRMSIGGPGQREVSAKSALTEVGITLQQTAWAAGIAGGLALVTRFAVIIPVTRWLIAQAPQMETWLIRTEPRVSALLVVVALCLPPAVMVVSFILQIFNVNFPPPYSAANPANGFFGGMFRRQQSGAPPAPSEQYDGRAPSIPDPEQQRPNVEILIRDEKTGATQRACPDLTMADWQRLQRYFQRGGRSVSQTDLENEAHFSRGRGGRARMVNKALVAWHGLTRVGEQEKPMVIEPFAAWVMRRGYGTNEALPSPV